MEAIDKIRLLASPWISFGQGRPAIPAETPPDAGCRLARRNPELAAEAMREHIAVAKHKALSSLSPYFESQEAG